MGKTEIHCLFWPNMDRTIVDLHQRCFASIGIDLIYDERRIAHGEWLGETARNAFERADVVGFIDIDCLVYAKETIDASIAYARDNASFIGVAQSANHMPPSMQIYAAPSYLFISKAAYEHLGRPDMQAGRRQDAAQDLSSRADARGFPYRCLYPLGFEAVPSGGLWRLGNYGHYGIGTEYEGGIFHLFQSRGPEGLEFLSEAADRVLSGKAVKHPRFACTDLSLSRGPAADAGNALRRQARLLTRHF